MSRGELFRAVHRSTGAESKKAGRLPGGLPGPGKQRRLHDPEPGRNQLRGTPAFPKPQPQLGQRTVTSLRPAVGRDSTAAGGREVCGTAARVLFREAERPRKTIGCWVLCWPPRRT